MSGDNRPSLDALRGILSLIVVTAHAWQTFHCPTVVLGIFARVAVLWFFCLSGYVVTMSLHANKRRGFDLFDYASARVFRIAPPLLAVIGLTAAAQVVLSMLGTSTIPATATRSTFWTDPAQQLIALVSLCTAGDLTGAWLNGPLWSLTFEIRLYVVAGLVAGVLWSRKHLTRALLLACLAMYLETIEIPLETWPRLDLQITSFAAFGFGAGAYALRFAPTKAVLVVVAAGLISAAFLRNDRSVISSLDSEGWLAAQVALSIVLAGLVLLVGRSRIGEGFLTRASSYSYTLYIGHFPLLLFLYFVTLRIAPWLLDARWAPLSAVCALAVTWLALARLGRWVERPKQLRAFISTRLRISPI